MRLENTIPPVADPIEYEISSVTLKSRARRDQLALLKTLGDLFRAHAGYVPLSFRIPAHTILHILGELVEDEERSAERFMVCIDCIDSIVNLAGNAGMQISSAYEEAKGICGSLLVLAGPRTISADFDRRFYRKVFSSCDRACDMQGASELRVEVLVAQISAWVAKLNSCRPSAHEQELLLAGSDYLFAVATGEHGLSCTAKMLSFDYLQTFTKFAEQYDEEGQSAFAFDNLNYILLLDLRFAFHKLLYDVVNLHVHKKPLRAFIASDAPFPCSVLFKKQHAHTKRSKTY